MNEEQSNEKAPDKGRKDTPAPAGKPAPPADCRVLKHRARVAGAQLAKGSRIALPMDMAKSMEAAGLVEIVGVADAQK